MVVKFPRLLLWEKFDSLKAEKVDRVLAWSRSHRKGHVACFWQWLIPLWGRRLIWHLLRRQWFVLSLRGLWKTPTFWIFFIQFIFFSLFKEDCREDGCIVASEDLKEVDYLVYFQSGLKHGMGRRDHWLYPWMIFCGSLMMVMFPSLLFLMSQQLLIPPIMASFWTSSRSWR